jgi:hypothetical protein
MSGVKSISAATVSEVVDGFHLLLKFQLHNHLAQQPHYHSDDIHIGYIARRDCHMQQISAMVSHCKRAPPSSTYKHGLDIHQIYMMVSSEDLPCPRKAKEVFNQDSCIRSYIDFPLIRCCEIDHR